MRVGIIGTRGIPNAYGGFEEFAQHLGIYLVGKGHEAVVYSSALHPFQEGEYEGVKIIHRYDPEDKLGTIGQFIYDFNCIRHARGQNFDVILQLGYTSSSVWSWLMPREAIILTNMDGLEWKRSKFSQPVQSFLRRAESWAVKGSHGLVADNPEIKRYLDEKYRVESTCIAYGAIVPSIRDSTPLQHYGLEERGYDMLIARMVPENNLEMILEGRMIAKTSRPLLVIGDKDDAYSSFLREKFGSDDQKVRFMGAIYDKDLLDCLRQHCGYYLHGHSVGGTNPSLIEAMACEALILAHENAFNLSVLRESGVYFSSAQKLAELLDQSPDEQQHDLLRAANLGRAKEAYDWGKINAQYLDLFERSLAAKDSES